MKQELLFRHLFMNTNVVEGGEMVTTIDLIRVTAVKYFWPFPMLC